MRVRFLKSFSKDIDRISNQKDKDAILETIFKCEKAESINDLKGIKKLSGSADAYRIRVRNYRIGIFFSDNEFVFARVLHRKDVYKVFP